MFYALALFTSALRAPSFLSPRWFFFLYFCLFPTSLSDRMLQTRKLPLPGRTVRRARFFCHSLVTPRARLRLLPFPYNGNLSVNSDAHVSLIFAYIMEYYVFFPPRASHFSPLTDRPEVLCNGLCENTPRLRR